MLLLQMRLPGRSAWCMQKSPFMRHHFASKHAVIFGVMQAVPLITADEFDAMISDDSHVLVVLDIRSKDEYKQGYDMPRPMLWTLL